MKASSLLALCPSAVLASAMRNVAFLAQEKHHLLDFISAHKDIDYGCRPVIMPSGDENKLHAIVTEAQLHQFQTILNPSFVRVERLDHLNKRQTEKAPIGTGDRFEGGKTYPRGLGSRDPNEYNAIPQGGILNADEVYTAMKGLEKEYGMQLFTPPHKTFEGNTLIGGVVNKAQETRKDKQHIYFTSGIHARERGGPDNLIYFISDLLYADKHRIGLTYGNNSYTNMDVRRAVAAGIVFIPMTNPDGVRHDQAKNNYWRKNRNPASSRPDVPLSVGVDLNRNFDFLWNYTQHYDPAVHPASNDPSSNFFFGTAPFSEPETRNIAWVHDVFPKIRWYIDVHSAMGTMLYSWGDDQDQTKDPTQNFSNPVFDGKRGVINDNLYGEYIDQADWDKISITANRTTKAMHNAGGRNYIPRQSIGIYPSSGASDDWTFSRWHKDKSVNKVYGFTMEFGHPSNFYPTTEEYMQNIIDTNAGFMEFILTAAGIGLADRTELWDW